MTKIEIESAPLADSQTHAAPFSESRPEPSRSNGDGFLRRLCAGLGLFLLVLGVYVLTSPGRIDTIDGEARFDVAYSLVATGKPIFRDPLIGGIVSVPGRGGFRYSYYGAPASVFGAPLVWAGLKHALTIERAQFLFSLTSSLFGAGIALILFLFYLDLGLSLRKALLWSLASSFTTLVWPLSNSSFDNAQHAFFALAALYCAFLSARRDSKALALLGGLCVAVLILYQEYFVLLVPCLAFATLQWQPAINPATTPLAWSYRSIRDRADSALRHFIRSAQDLLRRGREAPGDARTSCVRFALFVAAAGTGLLLTFAYNDYRFGSWLDDGKFHYQNFPLFGNPITGFLTLFVSPGKSIFLYSPPVVLGIIGFAGLLRRTPTLAKTVAACGVVLTLFLSCILFAGGDWCWGPRYLLPLLPLFALAYPFARLKLRREAIFLVIALGLFIQGMALSVENQRYFNEQRLNDYFWAENPAFYLTHSALFARFGEIASLLDGVPATAKRFASVPLPTYSVLGAPPPRDQAAVWMRNFQIFFLPRPWPFWMAHFEPSARPINTRSWVWGLAGISVLGGSLVILGLRPEERV